ncbi:MAG: isochorismatase family protein [Thermodesulfobacteriota bacterium]
MREWQIYLPEEDRKIYEKAGYSARQPFGNNPALIIIDVVLSFTGTRPMPILEAIEEFPTSCGQAAWEALPKIKEILEVSRAAGIKSVFIKANPVDKYFAGYSTKGHLKHEQAFIKKDYPIHPMLTPLPDEYVCQKSKASAFFDTPLASYLHRIRADCVLITGCVTSGCVRSTTIDAWNAGFPPFIIEEGVFDRSRHSHLTSLYELNAKYATVITLEEAKAMVWRSRRGASERIQ